MRIAHLITRMIIGGAQENTLFNCLDLVRDFGDDCLLVTGPSLGPEGDLLSRSGYTEGVNKLPEQSRGGQFEIRQIDSLRRNIHPLNDWKAYRALKQVIRDYQPDVVHTHSAKAGLLGRLAAWSLKVPVVVHTIHGAPFHDFQPKPAREFFRRCERYAAGRCHHLISVADAMTDLMVSAKVAPAAKFTTIYSGMEVDPFLNADQHRQRVRESFGIQPDEVVVGKIARLFHLKGHDDLITSAVNVVKQCPKTRFLLVGDGILRSELEQRLESLGLKDRFIFAGLLPPHQVCEMIGAMDILVHTSLREGLARALPQALIAGKPAVSYDVDGAREVVISDVTGKLIPARDCQQLSAALIELINDREKRQRLGREGQRRFEKQFRHQYMTEQIRALYERLADTRGT